MSDWTLWERELVDSLRPMQASIITPIDHSISGPLISISTIHINSPDDGYGVWETIVFGSDRDDLEWRWDDEDEARIGHSLVKAWVQYGCVGPRPDFYVGASA